MYYMKQKFIYEVPDVKVLEMCSEGCIAASGNTPMYTEENESWDNE